MLPTATMFDAVTVGAIPADATIVAAYQNGLYTNVNRMRTRFPAARLVTITVNISERADFLDCERGDATVAETVEYVRARWDEGVARPGVYAAFASWPAILAGLKLPASAVAGRVTVWTAHPRPGRHICSPACGFPVTADGTQWAQNVPPGYDESLIYPDTFLPQPPKPPAPKGQPDMILVYVDPTTIPVGNNARGVFTWNGSNLAHVSDPASEAGLIRLLGQPATITWAQYLTWVGK